MAKYYDYPLEFVHFEQDERMAAGCGTYYTEYSPEYKKGWRGKADTIEYYFEEWYSEEYNSEWGENVRYHYFSHCGAGQGCFWVTEKWPDWED